MDKRIFRVLISGLLLISCLFGCTLAELPAPPKFLSKIDLSGPYDKDMPERYEGQLRGASLAADWAIPYIFLSLAMHYESAGDEAKALHYAERSIEEFRKRKDLTGEGTATTRKIFFLHEFGKIQDSFSLIRDKEKEWQTLPMKAFIDHNYGHYYLMNGDYAKAQVFLKKAEDENSDYKNDYNLMLLNMVSKFEYAVSLILTDYVPYMSGRYQKLEFDQAMYDAIRKNTGPGIAKLEEVLAMNREIRGTKIGKNTPQEIYQIMDANAYNFLGLAKGINGNREAALRDLALSSETARQARFRIGEMDSLFFLNQVYLLDKDINNGNKAAERLNETADRYRFPFYQVWAKYFLSRYYLGFGNTQKAIDILKDAAAVMEQQRADLTIDQLKETYIFNRQMIHENLVYLLAREGDFKGALEMAERAKSRILVDLLAGKDISRTKNEEDLMKEEGKLNGEILDVKKEIGRIYDEKRLTELIADLERKEKGYRGVVLKIKNENEELYSTISVTQTDPSDIQTLLDKDTTLIDYFVTDDTLYIWSIDGTRLHLERVRVSKADLKGLISSYLAAIAAKDKEKTGVLSQKLYDTLIKPVAPFVSAGRIGFIPHESLYYLPYAALQDRGTYLAERYDIFHLPNAGIMKYLKEKRRTEGLKLLAFGNPDLGDRRLDLPYAEVEVEKIKKRVPDAAVFLKGQATKSRVKELLDRFDIVHFATHGQFVEEAPVNSSLLLAPGAEGDGRLTALEIFKLRFSGRAVVMSACETALGKSATGSEIIGLNRSFLYAGSPDVVSTLWSIDDEITADFMDEFYGGIASGKSLAASLRQAQTAMIKKGYQPYYWAPFILTGKD